MSLINFAYATSSWDVDGQMATTSAKGQTWTSDIAGVIFNGFFDVILTILPYAIGIMIFYIGYRLARRALSGS